ncbi:MAG: AI-2E family transporter [bacterium]|nr:AI-2E family transporter [bacterium]
MERKKLRDYLRLGTALLVVWFLLGNIGAVVGFVQKLWLILSPFILGAALAFVLNVPMSFFERKVLKGMDKKPALSRWKRPVALVMVFLLAIFIVYLVLALVIPELINTVETLVRAIPVAVQKLEAWLAQYEVQLGEWLSGKFTMPTGDELNAMLQKALNFALKGVAFSGSLIGSVYTNILDVFFTLMFVIYFLLGKERLAAQGKKLMKAYLKPERVERILHVAGLSRRTFASFITGQCLEALILGGMFFIVLSILRMPYVLLISVFIAVTALIPVVGAWMGCAVGAFLILVVNPMQALIFLAVFLIVQQLEGNLVYPRVMGNAIGLPSIWVLFAVVLGEGLLGILGMLLFIPLTSVCYQLLREDVDVKLRQKLIDPQ